MMLLRVVHLVVMLLRVVHLVVMLLRVVHLMVELQEVTNIHQRARQPVEANTHHLQRTPHLPAINTHQIVRQLVVVMFLEMVAITPQMVSIIQVTLKEELLVVIKLQLQHIILLLGKVEVAIEI